MSQYPQIAAGDELTSDLLMSMVPVCIMKASDTSRTSNATTSDDPELTLTLEANATYEIRLFLHYQCGTTGLIQTKWTVPTGATGNKGVIGPASGNTGSSNTEGDGRFGVHGFATGVIYGARTTATNQNLAMEEGFVTTSSGGTFAIAWAQSVSNATATSVMAGTRLWVRRIA